MQSSANQRLPEIAVFGPPIFFRTHEKEFDSRFRILRTWNSPIPLTQLLASEAGQIEAVIVAGFVPFTAEVIAALPSLRLVVAASRGLDRVDLTECRRRGITVTNPGTIFSDDVADLAVGLLLDVLRRITAGNRYVRSGFWTAGRDWPLGFQLASKKCGIVGLGSIGLAVAKRLQSFGCEILYTSRKKNHSVPYNFYTHTQDLASASDFLILCCDLNNETLHLIKRETLLALGKQGVVVNIARGSVVDENALVQCLKSGEIAGAGLDVFETEPMFSGELLEMDNVVLTPHAAVFTEESFRALFELTCANLDNFFNSKPLRNVVALL